VKYLYSIIFALQLFITCQVSHANEKNCLNDSTTLEIYSLMKIHEYALFPWRVHSVTRKMKPEYTSVNSNPFTKMANFIANRAVDDYNKKIYASIVGDGYTSATPLVGNIWSLFQFGGEIGKARYNLNNQILLGAPEYKITTEHIKSGTQSFSNLFPDEYKEALKLINHHPSPEYVKTISDNFNDWMFKSFSREIDSIEVCQFNREFRKGSLQNIIDIKGFWKSISILGVDRNIPMRGPSSLIDTFKNATEQNEINGKADDVLMPLPNLPNADDLLKELTLPEFKDDDITLDFK